MESIKEKLNEFFAKLGIEVQYEITPASGTEVPQVRVATVYPEDARLLIGEGGQNLAALEHLIRRLLYKDTVAPPPVFVDVNGYRAHQIEALKDEVRDCAKRVRLYRKEIRLRPMSSFERRVVHMALAEYPDLTTESIGQDPARMVVIKPYP
ncbi:MAG: R3H domain-containing nucleic acid-binding protein [bacterium]|nr:R3H domain-containing nucleic acid-binding protein [bacterium]